MMRRVKDATVSKTVMEAIGCQCLRCGHEWLPRTATVPKQCPACKSRYWNEKRDKHGRKVVEREAAVA